MMASTKVFECEICNEDYDATDRKPTGLPCGHTFCYLCLVRLATGGIICPQCRKLTSQSVHQLPVIFALIPPSEKLEPNMDRVYTNAPRCLKHNCNLDHFCADCCDILCRKCCRQSHQRHRVEYMQDILKKDEVASEFTRELRDKIDTKLTRLTNASSVLSKIVQSVNEMNGCKKKVKECEDVLLAMKVTVTEDLNSWNSNESMSVEEEQELFKRLCKAWKEGDALLPHEEISSEFLTKVDELIASSNHVQRLAQALKNTAAASLAGHNSKAAQPAFSNRVILNKKRKHDISCPTSPFSKHYDNDESYY